MHDPATGNLFQADQRPKTPMVDSVQPRTGGVREVGAGVGAVADEQGGEGLAQRLAPGCPIWCGAAIDGEVNYCCPSCREICEGLSA